MTTAARAGGPARWRLGRGALAVWQRAPLARLVLRQEYAIALARVGGPDDLAQVSWTPALTRDLVADAEYVADPFLLRRGGRWWLFFEVLSLRSGRGELAAAWSDDLRGWTPAGVVLREAWHLSYPQVFAHGGEVYMVPESAEARRVSLYRATDFPRGWERVADLVEGDAYVDASLLQDPHSGWWLVTGTARGRAPLAFRAERPEGPWRPVPARAPGAARWRGAGRMFPHAGAWHRPVQGGGAGPGRVYGEDVALMRAHLSDAGYEEHPAGLVLAPAARGWNALGMHHLDLAADPDGGPQGGYVAAVDGKGLVLDLSVRRAALRLRARLAGGGG